MNSHSACMRANDVAGDSSRTGLARLLPLMTVVFVGYLMGAYTAFLDVSLAFTDPGLGLASVFLASALVVLLAAIVALQSMPRTLPVSTLPRRDGSALSATGEQ